MAALQQIPAIANSLETNFDPQILNNISEVISQTQNLINLQPAVGNIQINLSQQLSQVQITNNPVVTNPPITNPNNSPVVTDPTLPSPTFPNNGRPF